MINLRQFLAGVGIAGLATFATAGIASAQTNTPTNPGGATTQQGGRGRCDKAKDRLAKLEAARVKSEQRIDQLNKAIADAQAHHRDDLVKKLETRRDKVQKRHDKIVDVINKIHARCGV